MTSANPDDDGSSYRTDLLGLEVACDYESLLELREWYLSQAKTDAQRRRIEKLYQHRMDILIAQGPCFYD